MTNNPQVKLLYSHRRISFQMEEEEIVMQFSQPTKRRATEEIIIQDNSQRALLLGPISGLFNSEE